MSSVYPIVVSYENMHNFNPWHAPSLLVQMCFVVHSHFVGNPMFNWMIRKVRKYRIFLIRVYSSSKFNPLGSMDLYMQRDTHSKVLTCFPDYCLLKQGFTLIVHIKLPQLFKVQGIYNITFFFNLSTFLFLSFSMWTPLFLFTFCFFFLYTSISVPAALLSNLSTLFNCSYVGFMTVLILTWWLWLTALISRCQPLSNTTHSSNRDGFALIHSHYNRVPIVSNDSKDQGDWN